MIALAQLPLFESIAQPAPAPRYTAPSQRISPLQWVGGKARALPWLLPRLPHTEIYIEPFGGSGVVLLNKPPCKMDVYNDLNGGAVNFFKVLRDNGKALQKKLELTPYAREEYVLAQTDESKMSELERARRFFVRVRMSFGGLSVADRNAGFGRRKSSNNVCMSGDIAKATEVLPRVIERLRGVLIECHDVMRILKDFDQESALFYCDPPYLHGTRKSHKEYGRYEMEDEAHEAMLIFMQGMKAKIAISGYDSPVYARRLSGWYRHGPFEQALLIGTSSLRRGKKRQEYLWTNYQILNGKAVS